MDNYIIRERYKNQFLTQVRGLKTYDPTNSADDVYSKYYNKQTPKGLFPHTAFI